MTTMLKASGLVRRYGATLALNGFDLSVQAGTSYEDAIPMVVVSNDELTMHVRREHLLAVAGVLRNEPSLFFEMCLGVSGVHYLADTGAELHAVYHLLSITHNRRIRLEVAVTVEDLRSRGVTGE